jgi:hypothetical protein
MYRFMAHKLQKLQEIDRQIYGNFLVNKKLSSLTITGSKITHEGVLTFSRTGSTIVSLDISKNIRLGGDCIRGIGMMLLCIQDLRFDDCPLITSGDVAGLGEIMGRGRKSLVSLSLKNCVKVRNSAVEKIIENCTRLTYLNLSVYTF